MICLSAMCRTLNSEGHPRQHPLLTVSAEIDVGAQIIAVAQVFDEADKRVGAVLGYVRVLPERALVQHSSNRRCPFRNDRIEMAIDNVGRGAP